jgi:dihydropyrimidinase
MKRLLRGGTVVSGSGSRTADLLIDGEKIAAVGENLACADAQVTDVSGKLLFPGFIDAHTHFDLDVCNTTTADDFYTGSRSAIRGGTTMVIDFACPNKGESLAYGLQLWHRKADGRSACDYGFHMTIDDWNESIRAEIPAMFEAGIPSFKMYMTYPAMMIGDKDMFFALEELKKYGGIAGVHCENSGVIDALIEQHKKAGLLAPGSHPECRPNPLEAEAVSHLLRIAEVADTPVVIVHLSTKESLHEVLEARARGQKVYVETCPHYLLLDDSRYYQEPFTEAARFICAPPLRKKADQEVLWKALADGAIQTVSTDHCSFTLAQKDAGKDDFTKIPGGLPGVETRGVLLYSYGVAEGRITKEQMCALLSENPAKLYGAYPRKGVLAEGSDADIVVYDPKADSVITAKDQLANVDYTPFEGFKTKGSIAQVYLRGRLAVSGGELRIGSEGKYIPRKPGKL